MNRRTTSLATLIIGLLLTGISLAQEKPRYKELPNFHEVNANLYRGAQPKSGGIQQLKQLGIKTIINLRDNDNRAEDEKVSAEAAGLRYFNIPLSSFDRPADKTVNEVLALINSPENQPVFLHCSRGADRTGTIVAIYRIEHDGWTSGKAKAEARRYGMGFWQVGMKDYIHDYYERRSRQTTDAQSQKPVR